MNRAHNTAAPTPSYIRLIDNLLEEHQRMRPHHEAVCPLCKVANAVLAENAKQPAAKTALTIDSPKFWDLVAECGGTKDLRENARALLAHVDAHVRAAVAAQPPAAVANAALPDLPSQHEELTAYWKCDGCDGRGHDGELHYQGHFQPPEAGMCGDCQGAGRVSTEAYTDDQMHAYARAALAAAGINAPQMAGREGVAS